MALRMLELKEPAAAEVHSTGGRSEHEGDLEAQAAHSQGAKFASHAHQGHEVEGLKETAEDVAEQRCQSLIEINRKRSRNAWAVPETAKMFLQKGQLTGHGRSDDGPFG